MNKHQVNGAAKEAAGKIQKNVGKATANGSQVVKGKAREMAGKAEKALGNAKDDADEVADDVKGDVKRGMRDRDIERHTR